MNAADAIERLWPLRALRIRTPRLELRLADDALLAELADLATRPIHDPATMPFEVPWTDAEPVERARSTLQFHWRTAGALTPESWHLPFVVLHDGRVVGTQSLMAEQFAERRTVSSGSWITASAQGRGFGTEARAGVLHLAFDGLGALRAETAAWDDNVASQAVTRSLGYQPDGERIGLRRGRGARQLRFALDRERWAAARHHDVTLVGLAPCLPFLGADRADGGRSSPAD